MSNRIKPELFCEGCLSTDRKLSELGNINYIYFKLLSDEYQVSRNPLMCWECKAILQNIQQFQERVKQSYCILNASCYSIEKEKNSLSRLKICPQTHNIILYEEDMEIKEECNTDDLVHDRAESYKEGEIVDNYLNEKICPQTHDIILYEEDMEIKEECNTDDLVHDRAESYKEDSPCEDIKSEIDIYSNDSFKDYETDIKIEENVENSKKEEKIPQIINKRRKSFTNIRYSVKDLTKEELAVIRRKCQRVVIDNIERDIWREKARQQRNYRLYKFKCVTCLMAFSKKVAFDRHMKKYHSEFGEPYECDICKRRVPKKNLACHIKSHNEKYICCMCNYECYKAYALDYHVLSKHGRVVECVECKMQFTNRPECNTHYIKLHLMVKCDHCGRGFKKKTSLIHHLKVRHSENKCKDCGRVYKRYDSLKNHIEISHVKAKSEHTFCVECNLQFDNEKRFKLHLLNSSRHRIKRFPCPECEKVYNRRSYLNNHFNHIHLKKTKHYCESCDRYFLNAYRLREHKRATHDRVVRKKTKICATCGRSFATNRILENHIRTHTGERPFSCEYCYAAFAQKTALNAHIKAKHKLEIVNKTDDS